MAERRAEASPFSAFGRAPAGTARTTRLALVSGIAVSSLVLWLAAALAATQLSIVSWGGVYADSQRKAYFEPFQAMHPGKRILVSNAGGDQVKQLRDQARFDNVTWDLVDVVAADAIRLCKEGLALPIWHDAVLAPAPDGSTASQDFGQTIISPCFIPQIVYSTTFAYRIDKVPAPPTSVCDVFDLERFPGKRALEKRPINNLEWALVCDGVPPEKIYEVLDTDEGIERALNRLSTIKKDIVWWKQGDEPAQMLAKGTVIMASAYNGRLFPLVSKKSPKVAMLWDRQIFDFDGWIIPKRAPHLNDALNFVRFATDTQRLADQARYIPYGPARRSSASLVGTHAELGIDMKPFMPTSVENAKTALIYNYDWWAQHRDDVDRRFEIWLAE